MDNQVVSIFRSQPLKAEQVAEWIGCSERSVTNMAKAGKIPARQVPCGLSRKCWMFDRDELETWWKEQQGAA